MLFAAEMREEAIAARSTEAHVKLKTDIAAVARLHENLTAARKRVKVTQGRPKSTRNPLQKRSSAQHTIALVAHPRNSVDGNSCRRR